MAASQKVNITFSDDLEEEEDGVTMLDVVWGQLREVCAETMKLLPQKSSFKLEFN